MRPAETHPLLRVLMRSGCGPRQLAEGDGGLGMGLRRMIRPIKEGLLQFKKLDESSSSQLHLDLHPLLGEVGEYNYKDSSRGVGLEAEPSGKPYPSNPPLQLVTYYKRLRPLQGGDVPHYSGEKRGFTYNLFYSTSALLYVGMPK